MKKFAVIVAGGSGSRMRAALPKQFLEIQGRPLLYYTIESFLEAFDDIVIILVMHPQHFEKAKDVLVLLSRPFAVQLTQGGDTRTASVRAGLQLVDDDSIVFVHDGVRCLITPELLKRCYEAALAKGNAVPAISAVDSIRIVKGNVNEAIDRTGVKLVQTPQTFHSSELKHAYAVAGDIVFTDDAAVAENAGAVINLVEGEPTNIKVTVPFDLLIAELWLSQKRRS